MTAKYGDWTCGEDEAILNIIGGTDVARAVLRGERKITVEEIARQQPVALPPLVGTLVKTIVIKPYKARSIAEAIKLGKYDYHDDNIALFTKDEVGITAEVGVDLFQYDRDWIYDEVIAWAKENGNKKPILSKHIYGIGIHLPDEQRLNPIVEVGSVRDGSVLCINGDFDWRRLFCYMVSIGWNRNYLVGFLSE